MAYAAEEAAAGLEVRNEGFLHAWVSQVGGSDDPGNAGAGMGLGLLGARRLGDGPDELGFADAAQMFGAVAPVARKAFDEHGSRHMMA